MGEGDWLPIKRKEGSVERPARHLEGGIYAKVKLEGTKDVTCHLYLHHFYL